MTATNLAALLDRAAAFLRALPEGTPEPELNSGFGAGIYLKWYRTPVGWAFVRLDGPDGLQCEWRNGNDRADGIFAFDGATVPIEVLSAIRRVTNG